MKRQQYTNIRKMEKAARIHVRVWGELRGDKWVLLHGTNLCHRVVASFNHRSEMTEALVNFQKGS